LQTVRIAPELDRQVFGYWFGPDELIPPSPVGRPMGAVLPILGASMDAPEIVCLDLVLVQNDWAVLSELGRYTYRHTWGLMHDEEWRFVPVPEAVGDWPEAFAVAMAPSLTYAELEARYGAEVASRARSDAPNVQLCLIPGADFEIALPPGDELSTEERAALDASLDRALDDSDAGRGVDAYEFLRQYRARRANHS
jgi:hypothetical protein